ncbi:MAG: hypothetical protein GXO03_02995 [Aquificae bacterium]|nr:hypothetical protein [Aquificota bacterium]
MKIHPLVIYFLIGIVTTAYVAYALYYSFLNKYLFVLRYGMVNNVISIPLAVLAVVSGFAIQSNPYVQQKVPFVFLFPHKWIGIIIAVYTVLSFAVVWVKQEELPRSWGTLIGLIGLGLVVAQVTFGWLMRLMFF